MFVENSLLKNNAHYKLFLTIANTRLCVMNNLKVPVFRLLLILTLLLSRCLATSKFPKLLVLSQVGPASVHLKLFPQTSITSFKSNLVQVNVQLYKIDCNKVPKDASILSSNRHQKFMSIID